MRRMACWLSQKMKLTASKSRFTSRNRLFKAIVSFSGVFKARSSASVEDAVAVSCPSESASSRGSLLEPGEGPLMFAEKEIA